MSTGAIDKIEKVLDVKDGLSNVLIEFNRKFNSTLSSHSEELKNVFLDELHYTKLSVQLSSDGFELSVYDIGIVDGYDGIRIFWDDGMEPVSIKEQDFLVASDGRKFITHIYETSGDYVTILQNSVSSMFLCCDMEKEHKITFLSVGSKLLNYETP